MTDISMLQKKKDRQSDGVGSGRGGASEAGVRQSLRGMSYAEGQRALSLGPGTPVQRKEDAGPRTIPGEGGYTYQQWPDGTIKIASGPSGAGVSFAPGTAVNQAITKEIGAYPATTSSSAAADTSTTADTGSGESVVGGLTKKAASMGVSVTDWLSGALTAVAKSGAALYEWAVGSDDQTVLEQNTEGGADAKKEKTPTEQKASDPIPPGNHQSRDTFVRDSVEEIALTTTILGQLYRYFPLENICVGGYLNDSQQFWKVNYHWEYMIWIIDHSLGLSIGQTHKDNLQAIKDKLNENAPTESGYMGDAKPGDTGDDSTSEKVLERWKTMKQAKKDLKAVVIAGGIVAKSSKKQKTFDLAYAPVAKPGTSKHGSGYALDIAGDNAEIGRICNDHGASLVFDEASHVHVEFKNGVS